VAGALAALDLLEERPRLVEKLRVNAATLRAGLEAEGFDLRGSATHLLPIVIGDPELTVKICEQALARGVFAQAIAPPAVAGVRSRVRLTAMASHRTEELRAAAAILGQVARAVGFDPSLAAAFDEPDEEAYETEPAEEYEVSRTGPYDYEQVAHAA
jgi:glycine C-acetyltransferase/8-amino-7-oxononanoate synthase